MPASEQIWRNIKLMHVIFGVASMVMLISTIWMLADDHAREWKQYRLQARDIDTWALDARLRAEQTAEKARSFGERQRSLAEARSSMIRAEDLEAFRKELERDADRRGVEPPGFAGIEESFEQLRPLVEQVRPLRGQARDARTNADLDKAERRAAAGRQEVLDQLQKLARAAKLREDNLSRRTKFRKADLTAEVSHRDIAVGLGRQADDIQQQVDVIKEDVEQFTDQRDAAKDHRLALEMVIQRITADESLAEKQLEESRAELERLHATLEKQKGGIGEWLVRQPVLDAFYTAPDFRIDQIWLPQLKIDYNFQDVARFDRCVTCHSDIDQTAPGSSVQPENLPEHKMVLVLETPAERPQPRRNEEGEVEPPTLLSVYGFQLADEGRMARDDVTIQFVVPQSIAARAGLLMGDVIEEINEARVHSQEEVYEYLLGSFFEESKPLELAIRRGLPNPYIAHPRLDLYVGSLSPHKKEEMGCTICHDGQGSATAFKYASHTPNNPDLALRWSDERGWFDNHFWLYPMHPERFNQSGCLKCHHEVVELEPSQRFPEPPAPKVVHGWNLVKEFGCYGCHEINGYDGPDRRIGPDLRTEPNYAAVAQALLELNTLGAEEQAWAQRLVTHPEDDETRRRLWGAMEEDRTLAASNSEPKTVPRFSADAHELGSLLKDVETPGTLRKVGPSLRHLASKVDFTWLYSWLRKPSDFRPTTRMPQFFGLWEHLDGKGLAQAQAYEPIEIRAIAEYLLSVSKPFEYLPRPAGVTEEPSAERGKQLLQTRGCLACHVHQDFPGMNETQGPDLARVGAKLGTPDGQKWLYSWLKNPSHYHPRTKMPNLLLDPLPQMDVAGKATGKITDPAADLVAFFLQPNDWRPENVPPRELAADEQEALYELAVEYLAGTVPNRRARQYLDEGIPPDMASMIKGAEKSLLGISPSNRVDQQLLYVGQSSIAKYGCAGCHDIPGFEGAKPIGTTLADWGRKESSRLAFELIGEFLATHGEFLGAHGVDGDGKDSAQRGQQDHSAAHSGHGLSPLDFDPDTGFYVQAINAHHRAGFIWQKLRMPRSFDYQKTENKGYLERLRMPKFPLDEDQIEAIITFVLGLVADPPAEKYIYQPDARQEAVMAGRQVLDKYNCGGCHILQMDRWEFDYRPYVSAEELGDYGPPSEPRPDYPFLVPDIPLDAVQQSLRIDHRGLRHAVVHGMPDVSEQDRRPLRVDEDGAPLDEDDTETPAYDMFVLWEPALIDGQLRDVGTKLLVRENAARKYPALGGALARYLFPVVIADEKQRNPQAKGSEAWSWLPPPLVGEGNKVQSEWLHDFLLDPHAIRPAVFLRMPKFNMSSEEASKLANYFAAVEKSEYPYEFDRRRREDYLQAAEQRHPGYLGDALRIIVDGNYCVKCHLVGDFRPEGSPTALAPDLSRIYERMRPDFVRNWVAKPTQFLPYTGMPVNIPFTDQPPYYGGVSQEIFRGTSIEQLSAVVDFLMNYDWYAGRQTSIRPLVKPATPQTEQQAGP